MGNGLTFFLLFIFGDQLVHEGFRSTNNASDLITPAAVGESPCHSDFSPLCPIKNGFSLRSNSALDAVDVI